MANAVQCSGNQGYLGEVTCQATREQVFAAVATVGGLRAWWTPIVAGVVEPDGLLTFGFEDLEEAIVMRVDEVTAPALVRWTCLAHTSAPDWAATEISFQIREQGPTQTLLVLRHAGLSAHSVAPGWDRFLESLSRYVGTGQGNPYRAGRLVALEVARAYYQAWTGRDFAAARRLLALDLQTEVPINSYAGREDFADAVARFGSLAERVDLLAEFGSGEQALLLYDMHLPQLGQFRVTEHFTVADGLIRRIRQVHDTAALRAAS